MHASTHTHSRTHTKLFGLNKSGNPDLSVGAERHDNLLYVMHKISALDIVPTEINVAMLAPRPYRREREKEESPG